MFLRFRCWFCLSHLQENGEEKCDFNLEISLYEDEVSSDWIESLSPEDYESVNFGYLKLNSYGK